MSSVNLEVATAFVDALARSGLRHACIAPGSRSGPLALALARHRDIRTWVHIDERAAGFFALGIAKRSGSPAAVLTTSGTAAAELHPAVVEASHSCTPLVVLTADRPPEARDRGANQTIDQSSLYGSAARWFFDPGPPDRERPLRFWTNLAARAHAMATAPVAGPVHVNFPFREPLLAGAPTAASLVDGAAPLMRVEPCVRLPDERTAQRLSELLGGARRLFVHAGTMPQRTRTLHALASLASRPNAVLHAEPASQLRRPSLPGLLRNTEALLREPRFADTHAPDVVLRLGAAPTSRIISDWLSRSSPGAVVLIDPDGRWLDPDSIATDVVHCEVAPLLEQVTRVVAPGSGWQREWREADARAGAAIDAALESAPLFEAHVVRALSATAPDDATVVIGSSMAIRVTDWFWQPDPRRRFIVNRGASGIDGLVSTALGAAAAAEGEGVVVLCGDLTLFHDVNGLLAAGKHGLPATFVVLNNHGGGIFSFLGEAEHADVFEDVFATPIDLELEQVAALYGCDYVSVDDPHQLHRAFAEFVTRRCTIIDTRFTREASVSGHRSVWSAGSSAILGARPPGRET